MLGGSVFSDFARNDYTMHDRELADERGRTTAVDVPRFHDAYQARGGNIEIGWIDRPFAKRLLLNLFSASFDEELQHNKVMSIPYGEVEYGQSVYGATLRYDVEVTPALGVEAVASYAHKILEFQDRGRYVYD